MKKREKYVLSLVLLMATVLTFMVYLFDIPIIKFIGSLRTNNLDYFFISVTFASNIFIIFFFLTTLFLSNFDILNPLKNPILKAYLQFFEIYTFILTKYSFFILVCKL